VASSPTERLGDDHGVGGVEHAKPLATEKLEHRMARAGKNLRLEDIGGGRAQICQAG
jgi:hypothetical protein